MDPELAAGLGVVANHRLHRSALLLGVEPIIDDNDRGPGRSDFVFPELRRWRALPIGRNVRSVNDAVSVGSATGRPTVWANSAAMRRKRRGSGPKRTGPFGVRGSQGQKGFLGARRPPPTILRLERGTETLGSNDKKPAPSQSHDNDKAE